MRIALVVAGFPPRWLAGTEIATANLARHLAQRGHDVHVLTSRDAGLARESLEQGYHVQRLGHPRIRVLGLASFYLAILLALRRIAPDVVHIQSMGIGVPSDGIGICGLLAQKLWRKPYVIWCRGYGKLPARMWEKSYTKAVLANAGAVIALTQGMRQDIQRVCQRDIVVIPNAVDLAEFDNLSRDQARSELRVAPDEKLILFVGRLRPEKGLGYLVDAMPAISRRHPRARLLVVGDGPERQSLEDRVAKLDLGKCVSFTGAVPQATAFRYLAAADVFVLPSLSEGFPNVLLEAMAAGLPVVTTRVSGLPEIIRDGANGFLVEPADPQPIADKVTLLLEDSELRLRFSTNNRRRAAEYGWGAVLERLEAVYTAVRANPPRQSP